MNTKLEKLFEKYDFSPKDRFEISQIFFLLTEEKKQNFLKNFEEFAFQVKKINSDIEIEKNILLDNAIEKIKQSILNERKNKLDSDVKTKMSSLKKEL